MCDVNGARLGLPGLWGAETAGHLLLHHPSPQGHNKELEMKALTCNLPL